MKTASLSTKHASADRQNQEEIVREMKHIESLDYINKLVNALPFIVAVLNRQRQIVFANYSLMEMMGMNKLFLFYILLVFYCNDSFTQVDKVLYDERPYNLETTNGIISGTLCTPVKGRKFDIALIIPGSGPTDRDGNSIMLPGQNNSLQMLARELAARGIATMRYDKRGIGESRLPGFKEETLRFDDYVSDVIQWIDKLEHDNQFLNTGIIGHSEGSLIGMLAAWKKNVDFYISLAGAGYPADQIIRKQVANQPDTLLREIHAVLDSLVAGNCVDSINPLLTALFRPSVQPYLISWMKYDPPNIISRLDARILIVQGDNDLQVDTSNAQRLAAANKNARLEIIKDMNHVLKITKDDIASNIAAYSNPDLPVAPDLIKIISSFIKGD
ncbi:MAG: alpha/beta hydrolase [Bacteroidota bacterium]